MMLLVYIGRQVRCLTNLSFLWMRTIVSWFGQPAGASTLAGSGSKKQKSRMVKKALVREYEKPINVLILDSDVANDR